MKTSLYLMLLFTSMLIGGSVTAQKYKTPADTIKLNKEYLAVSNEIADLTAKLTQAQNDLPGIRERAGEADTKAQNAADHSSSRADKATDGNVKDAKRAKRSAKTAYKKAKTSRSADANVISQEKKISRLSADLERKQKRLADLDDMRVAIYRMIPA
jgi:hypothetical protein